MEPKQLDSTNHLREALEELLPSNQAAVPHVVVDVVAKITPSSVGYSVLTEEKLQEAEDDRR